MTNEELAILCKTDESYLPELWAAVRRLIGMWALKYLPSDGSTARYEFDDLIQSAYFAMLSAIKDYPEDSPLKFTTYLYQHCRNAFRSVLGIRSNKREPSLLSLDTPLSDTEDITLLDAIEDESATQDIERAIDRVYTERLHEALEQALDTISDMEREVIRCRFYEDKTNKETAAALGVEVNSVRQYEYRGLQNLRGKKAYKILRPFNYHAEGLRGTGLSRFRQTGTSATEAAILRRLSLLD